MVTTLILFLTLFTGHASDSGKVSLSRAESLIAKLPEHDPWMKNPEGSTLAWGESYLLGAYMDLYEATGNPRFLHEVAVRGERLLGHRDDKRGVTDGSGQSRPAWSVGSKYVVASGILVDQQGKDLIAIRSTPSANNNATEVEIIPQPDGRLVLKVRNEVLNRFEEFENLSLDPKDERFLPEVVNDPLAPYSARPGNYSDKSNLIRVEMVGKGLPAPRKIRLSPIPLAFAGYVGVIYDPLIRFAETVKKHPNLRNFNQTAEYFIQAAEESYQDLAKRLWREIPGQDEGYYLMCEKGESMPADNVGQPFNYLARHVCVELALYRLTGKDSYLDRSRKMVNLFKNRLIYDRERDLYVWNYWYEPMTTVGWIPADNISFNVMVYPGKARVEDISHGGHDIAMVMAAHRMGLGFDDADVRRFANTFLKNVLREDRKTTARLVDGSGDYPAYFPSLYQWLVLAEEVPEVARAGKEIYENRSEETLPFTARLLKYRNFF